MAFWILLTIVMTVMVFKLGQAYERQKPKLEYRFVCLRPRCNFSLETNSMDETMKLANAHAEVHREIEEQGW